MGPCGPYVPPPAPWRLAGRKADRHRFLLLRGIYDQRTQIFSKFPWVRLPSGEPGSSTPVGALILAWEKFAYATGKCPRCGGEVVMQSITSFVHTAKVWGVCLECQARATRSILPKIIVYSLSRCVEGTPYRFKCLRSGWKFVGVPAAVAAVLGELGVDQLPKRRYRTAH